MFWSFRNRNVTVKELRKDMGYTTQELAFKLRLDHIELLNIDHKKLKEIDEPIRSKIIPILRGDELDSVPW
ncbi:transcriptional regulator [Ammoniphilus sp. CFH 90114]|uniref:transcriptional regulator n=1 Tax=Ammoniphilus sp. CFH 90114 TaxID=2493665 RepID=UPI00100F83EF|nr:transcriptional regulator [Ammoniphilus sp. CFH 90114]RXT02772.1 transcriptional regulator [Ammoniphilus sp. CFH 90114]